MSTRQEHWFGDRNAHIVFEVKETGSDVEPTGTVEISYELWADILDTLGFVKEFLPEELDHMPKT